MAANLYYHPLDTIESLRPAVAALDELVRTGEAKAIADERVPRGRILVSLPGGLVDD